MNNEGLLENKVIDLEKRVERQKETIIKLQNRVDNYIDFESLIKAKIVYHENKMKKYDELNDMCRSKENLNKLSVFEDLLEYISTEYKED